MTFFSKPSITFVAVNLIRLLSIVAICLAFSSELVVIISDVKGFKAAHSPSVVASTNTTGTRSTSSPTPSSGLSIGVVIGRRERIYPSGTPSAAPAVATQIFTIPASALSSNTTDPGCSYVGGTSVPKEYGGVLFAVLERIFCCLVLIFALVAEMPPPSRYTQRFWAYAFPPFGEDFGSGVLGVIQIFMGCSILSHALPRFPQVAGWLVFVTGFINVLFGLAFGFRIKTIRSVFASPGPNSKPSGLRSLTLQAARPATSGSPYHSWDTESQPDAKAFKEERKKPKGGMKGSRYPIVISSPQPVTESSVYPDPPVYGTGAGRVRFDNR